MQRVRHFRSGDFFSLGTKLRCVVVTRSGLDVYFPFTHIHIDVLWVSPLRRFRVMRDSSNHLLNRLLPDATDANGFIEWIYIYIYIFIKEERSIYVAIYLRG